MLITGASGLLGAAVCVAARRRKAQVVAVSGSRKTSFDGLVNETADLTVPGAAERLVERHRPDWIVHCAAWTDVDACEKDPERARRMNVTMTAQLARAAARYSAGLLYVSTDSVFDGTRGGYAENDAVGPVNVYAQTKLEGEAAAAAAPRHLIARTNIYGWNAQDKKSLGEWILGELQAGRDVPGFSDVVFSPLLTDDCADALLDLAAAGCTGVYHVAGSKSLSKLEFARLLAEVFGFPRDRVKESALSKAKLKAPRPLNTSLSVRKASRALGRRLPEPLAGLLRFRALRDGGEAAALKRMLDSHS